MKRDAALRKFDRLLVWKVSRLGRDIREVISTVYELSDLGITVIPIKSETGPINSAMGRLLWAIQAWFARWKTGNDRKRFAPGWPVRERQEGDLEDHEQILIIPRPSGFGRRAIVGGQEPPNWVLVEAQ